MSNSLGTITPVVIAQEALPILSASFPFLKAFAMDFSDEAIPPYQTTINTRVPVLQAVTAFDPVNGYVASSGVFNNVSVTINNHKAASVAFTDAEISSTPLNLVDQIAPALAYAVGNDIMASVAALWTTGNFSSSVSTASGAVMNRTGALVPARQTLNTNLVPDGDRYFISSPSAEASLLSDPSLVKLTYGAGGIVENGIPDAMGFKFGTYNAMPSTNGLLAVALHKSAIVLASRAPEIQPNASSVAQIENVVDPRTGLTIQVRSYYIPQLGRWQTDYVYMFGVAVGNSKCLVRLTN